MSPASTTDMAPSSTRKPTVGRTGAWSVGAAETRTVPSASTAPRSHSVTAVDGRHCRSAWWASRYPMSCSSMASVARTSAAVPAGPKTASGDGWNDVIQRDVMTSLRSVVWSLCRWVRNSAAERAGAGAGGRGAHEDAASAVEEQVTGGRADERGGTGSQRVGERAAAAQDDRLHGAPLV